MRRCIRPQPPTRLYSETGASGRLNTRRPGYRMCRVAVHAPFLTSRASPLTTDKVNPTPHVQGGGGFSRRKSRQVTVRRGPPKAGLDDRSASLNAYHAAVAVADQDSVLGHPAGRLYSLPAYTSPLSARTTVTKPSRCCTRLAVMEHFGSDAVALGPGWSALAEPGRWLNYAIILLLASCSGAALAYHPVYRRGPLHVADIEQRKTMMVYAAVGALIAVICATNASMAFVIFGIGGLMRFRTDLGASKHTGNTIIATLIGLCWGLGLQLVALFATGFFWCLIYWLERDRLYEVTIGGLKVELMNESAGNYRRLLESGGAVITAHDKSFKRGEMTFVFRLLPNTRVDELAQAAERMAPEHRGTPHWPDD